MNLWTLIALVPAFLVADFALIVLLRQAGIEDAQIDSTRMKRVVVWAIALWAIDGWRASEARFSDLTEALAGTRAGFELCMDEVTPRVGAMEDGLEKLWATYEFSTTIQPSQEPARPAEDGGSGAG